jgi:bifunctional pyridoxal-dependent enzyme with beta-cystathionase and maltose regulon repressor activities
LLIVRETVAVETLARLATSLMFMWCNCRNPVGKVHSSNDGKPRESEATSNGV